MSLIRIIALTSAALSAPALAQEPPIRVATQVPVKYCPPAMRWAHDLATIQARQTQAVDPRAAVINPHPLAGEAARVAARPQVPPQAMTVVNANVAPIQPAPSCIPRESADAAASGLTLPDLPAPPPPTPPPPSQPDQEGVSSTSSALTSEKFWVVVNNVNQTLICAYKLPGHGWSAWRSLMPAANWMPTLEFTAMHFQCAPPVERTIYALKPGERYNMLPRTDGLVELRFLTTTP
jgi:hypothetical protein